MAQGPNWASDWQNPAAYPTSHQNYPGDFGSSLGGSFPSDIWYYTPGQLAQIDAQFANRDPVSRFYFNDSMALGASLDSYDNADTLRLGFRWEF